MICIDCLKTCTKCSQLICIGCLTKCSKCNLEYCNSCCRICNKCNSAHCANCYASWYDGNKTITKSKSDDWFHYISRCPISGPFKVKAKIRDPNHHLFIGLQLNSGSNQNVLQGLTAANKGYSFWSANGYKTQFMSGQTNTSYGSAPGTDEFVIEMIYSVSKELSFVVNNQNYGTAFSLGDGHWFLLFSAAYANTCCEIQSVEFL